MKKLSNSWLGSVLAIAGIVLAGGLPYVIGPLIYKAFPNADWGHSGWATIALYSASLLIGLALEIYVFFHYVVAARKSTARASAVHLVTVVVSGTGALVVGSPFVVALVNSLIHR